MKVTAFLGSPRTGGNTDILAASVLKGAGEVGLETQSISLPKYRIGHCTGCGRCWNGGRICVQSDGMQELYPVIAETDILVLATPVYWYGPTGYMKDFLDRFVVFNRDEGRAMIRGKGAVLVTAYEEEGTEAVEPLIRMLELSFKYLEIDFIDTITAPGVGPKGAVLEKQEVLRQAYESGRRLANWTVRND
jgi:multimeric flavodoxin WrbA